MLNNSICSRSDAAELIKRYKSEGKRVVFTQGVFDIIHPGHINALWHFKKLGDILIVGIDNDANVRSLKGAERPINPEQRRLQVISNLKPVDHAILLNIPPDLSPQELSLYAKKLYKELQPDLITTCSQSSGFSHYIKGVAKSAGISHLDLAEAYLEMSTTQIIGNVIDQCKPKGGTDTQSSSCAAL